MARTFRLAVLECDTPFPTTKATRGSYANIFRDLLTKGRDIADSDVQLDVTKWDVVEAQEYPNVDDVDGFLLTGSKHAAFADDPWIIKLVEFVKSVNETGTKPVVGMCFGHQIIGRALGAKVGVNPGGWEISVDKINFNDEGQKLLGIKTVELHQMHRDAVLEVPKGTVNLGSSPVCEIQGLYQPGRIFSLQSHPEFDEAIMTELLVSRHELGIIDDRMYEEAMGRVKRPHGGAAIAEKIWEFLLTDEAVPN